jgi:hypothetical protein
VNPPDPVWHFSGRSQAAAWTALNGPYRDAVLDDRSDDAAEIMATEIAPDFEYVERPTKRRVWLLSMPQFVVHEDGEDEEGEYIEARPMTVDEARNLRIETAQRWKHLDWFAWVTPAQEYTFASGGPESAIVGLEDWIPLEPMFGGFDGIDRSIALDSDLHPPRIGERRRMLPSGRLPYGLVLEGMAPGHPTRFEFTDPGQGFDLERRADGWHVVQTVRVGGSLVVSAVDSPRGTLTLESPRQRSVPYRPRWARGLAATLAEIGAP